MKTANINIEKRKNFAPEKKSYLPETLKNSFYERKESAQNDLLNSDL